MNRAEYSTEELLPLSGIQHFLFCRRQWALIHIERQWEDNVPTVEGKLMHEQADDPFFTEVRQGVITSRSMPVASYQLGLNGVCDVVQFLPAEMGIRLPGRSGYYQVMPVEYKHGKEKEDPCDEAQLCAQAICLEEMLSCPIEKGCLFYGKTRRRVEIIFSAELRSLVIRTSKEMHAYFSRGYTPQVKPSKACKSCSLENLCIPGLQARAISASKYIQMQIDGE